jgi:hypothetical protein
MQTVAGHANLPQAVRELAVAMLTFTARQPLLDALFKDAGRYAATMFAYYLHETTELTRPRFRELCGRSHLMSAGRADALLDLLAHYQFAETQAFKGRTKRYVLTDRFLQAWSEHLDAALAAASALDPSLAMLRRRLDAAGLREFGRMLAGNYLAAMTEHSGNGHDIPMLRVVMHAYAGNHILWVLLKDAAGQAFPPVESGPITAHGLAHRFGVSRIHIRRVFDAAEAEQLIALMPDGGVRFSPAAQEQLRLIWAAQFAQILLAARQTEGRLTQRSHEAGAEPVGVAHRVVGAA